MTTGLVLKCNLIKLAVIRKDKGGKSTKWGAMGSLWKEGGGQVESVGVAVARRQVSGPASEGLYGEGSLYPADSFDQAK